MEAVSSSKKVALVTGASGGIGSAAALRLANDGFDIAVHYNSNHESAGILCEKIKNLGRRCVALKADLSQSEQVISMIEDMRICLGEPDVLCCCAGISEFAVITDISDHSWNTMLSSNLDSVFYCNREISKLMINRGHGSIINITSVWGIHGASTESHYSASKGAIISFSKSLAKELGPSGIRVNCIAPGAIDTAMNSHLDSDAIEDIISRTPLERLGTPEDVAGAVSFLASPDSAFVTGCTIEVTGGFY